MTFKASIWHPIAVVLTGINVVAAGAAAGPGEALHVTIHAALAVAFGLWAQRLRRGPGGSEFHARLEALEALELEALEVDVSRLRQELSDAQERIDFAERRLAQGAATRRVEPQR